MPVVERTITVDQSPDVVWRFLADFTTTEEWDPPTVCTERTSGNGGLGTTYHNVAKFEGRRTEVDYVVTGYDEGRCLELRGTAHGMSRSDRLLLHPAPGGGCQVTYRSAFELWDRPPDVGPVPLPSMESLGDLVAESLLDSLEHLPVG